MYGQLDEGKTIAGFATPSSATLRARDPYTPLGIVIESYMPSAGGITPRFTNEAVGMPYITSE